MAAEAAEAGVLETLAVRPFLLVTVRQEATGEQGAKEVRQEEELVLADL